MKKITTFLILIIWSCSYGQIEGTWRLAPNAGALAVGPNFGDYSWWSSSVGDVTARGCLFDDSITFEAGGGMVHYMDGSTWLEGWQGAAPEGCGAPVAPHDGTTNAPFSYTYNAGTGELTTIGVGAHVGLAKVCNAGELSAATPPPVPSSITYLTSFSGDTDTMYVDIDFGGGWWHFTYVRSSIWSLANPNVTFKVNMSDFTGTINTGVYVSGSFNGWSGNANPLTDMGNGIWETTLPLSTGPIEYKFTIDDWAVQENFGGTESCIDPINDGFNNRYFEVTGSDATLPAVCWESCAPCLTVDPQLVGTWKLKEEAASLAVGPNQGDGSWWSNNAADVTTRACLFDDSIKFEANGAMTHYMDGSTWLEAWQGMDPEGCGTPVAPHDATTNAPFSYSYNNATGELTTIGTGAHLGLPKVTNAGELSAANPPPVPSSVTYTITLADNGNTMIADINFGGGWWRFVYEKTQQVVVANPNVTFSVDMSEYTGTIGTSVYVSGDFNGWSGNGNPLMDMGNGIWEATIEVPVGAIQYKFTIDDWMDQENFTGTETCIDPINDGFFNRYYEANADATLPTVCFASCDPCVNSILENELVVEMYPNPAEGKVYINSSEVLKSISITGLNGAVVLEKSNPNSNTILDISSLKAGAYLVVVKSENKSFHNRLIVK